MSAGETVGIDDVVDATTASPGSNNDRRVSPLAVGVVVWLSSELMFFSGFFAAYFALRAQTHPWPPAGVELSTGRAAVATAVLVGSSFTMHLAVGASRRRDRTSAARWLVLTLILGAAFVANQAVEWAQSSFSISSHAYGSMFFLMTGFHGIHVIGGLIFMASIVWVISGSTSRAPVGPSVEMCAYYWHFVDAVWVVMFLTLYVLR